MQEKISGTQFKKMYLKRKRGLLKKAIEMSNKCDQDIFLVMLDRKTNRMVEFRSTENFNTDLIQHLQHPKQMQKIFLERYNNNDFLKLKNNLTVG